MIFKDIAEYEETDSQLSKDTMLRLHKEIERLGNELQVQIEDNTRLNEYIEEKDKEIERLNKLIEKYNKELKHKTEQYEFLRHYHNLKDMKQYPIERDVFCNIFRNIDKEFYDELYDVTTENFKCWRYDDEFYILHLNSGTLINWYKHLGRCNTCNKDLSISEYESIAKLLYNELKGSDK